MDVLKNKKLKSHYKSSRKPDHYKSKYRHKPRDKAKSNHDAYIQYLHKKERLRNEERKSTNNEDNTHKKYEERADRALKDLRERLLSKHKSERVKHSDDNVAENSEIYVREIIKISGEDRIRTIERRHTDREMPSRYRRSKSKSEQIKEIKSIEIVTLSDSEEEKIINFDENNDNDENLDEQQYLDKSRSRSNSCDSMKMETEENLADEDQNSKSSMDENLPPYFPAIQGCRSVEEFQCLNRIEEGTYGVVYRAKDKRTEEIVALKRLKMEKEKEGFPITSLREINTLLKGQHSNIVTVREIVVGSNMDKIFIVMDYVEHDLKSLMETMRGKNQNFLPSEVKCLLRQLLLAVAHLHDNWILHRDLKTSNLLLSHKGVLKVGDFGLAREYGSPLKAYTPIVVTLWYRAPELLLCAKEYSTPIDMWSVGCIFAEFLLMNALFPGKSEVDQLNRVFKDLGSPSEKLWHGFDELPGVKKMKLPEYPTADLKKKFDSLTELGLSFLLRFLTYDPTQRITAEQALTHEYFEEVPLPISPSMFPTWPAKSELGQKRAMAASPKPPSGGGEYKRLKGDDDNYGFRLGGGSDLTAGFNLKF
ncbi:unnamed protein product [Brassicogethes aeneus]|uniref:cyclin-dependent kinase n=1 Tax=Brassicogethes aeneus TaxID=1431903 RepID=A0A9P0B3M4_BRAAE|nr:unnamed protein product [Brassicogethes aeneus]